MLSSTALQSPSPSGDQLGLLIIADLILPKLLVWPPGHDNLVMLLCDGQYACSSGKADDGSSLHVGVVGDGELWSYLKFTGDQQYRYLFRSCQQLVKLSCIKMCLRGKHIGQSVRFR